MAAHRYWRFANIVPAGGGALEITELQLLDGTTRVDTPATLTTSLPPTSGGVESLRDGSVGSAVTWRVTKGLSIDFAFGAAAEVNNFRMGSGASPSTFVGTLALQWSDDGVNYTTLRQGDTYVWPGPFAWTRNVVNATRVRSYGAVMSQNGDVALSVPMPPLMEPGDLLVAFTVSTVNPPVGPAGWSLLSTVGPVGSVNNYLSMWSKVATEADRNGAYNGTNNTNGQVLALASGIGTPSLESSLGAFDNLNVRTKDLPVITASGDGRLGLGAGYWTLAFISGTTDMAVSPIPPWLKLFAAQAQLRMGVAALPGMKPGDATVGTWSTTATGTGGGWAVLSAIFASSAAIESTPFPVRGMPVAYLPPAQPNPAQIDMGRARSISPGKFRRLFAETIVGQGNGRVRGFTLDYVNPLNKPYPCRVRLVREADGQQVRETWSNANGAYDFQFVDELQSYTVVAYYLAHGKRAVVTDGLTLANGKVELMP
ncbi:hypothetical protein [uncultured Variovorax sp.]|uniref:hypothetical protein n=1 Tax=uncultured Variovorax sp. TaxID=114708 RepID=UPI0025CC7C17|nr:hypothetical protein [uncultured Variovorax sp.]